MTQLQLRFEDLLDRFGAVVLSRQLHVMQSVPEVLSSGYDVDLVRGQLRFRSTGRATPIQIIGTEWQNTWMWAWANETMAPELTKMSAAVRDWGGKHDIPLLMRAGLRLDEPTPGAELTGMGLSAVAAGLLDGPAIFVCFDRARAQRLYVLMLDEAMREPPPDDPLEHVVYRFPLCLAQAALSSHDGGVALTEWLPALAGFCQAHGVNITVDDDRRGRHNGDGDSDGDGAVIATLRWRDRTAFVKKDARGLRMELAGDAALLDAMADVVRDSSVLNLAVSMEGDGVIHLGTRAKDSRPLN